MWRIGLRFFLCSVLFFSISTIQSGFSLNTRFDGDVRSLAHQIDELADSIHRRAEERAHHGTLEERQALRDLHTLSETATHFHSQVESWWQDPNHTQEDYRNLVNAYEAARWSFERLHTFWDIKYDFQRLGELVNQLRSYYNGGGQDIRKLAHQIDELANYVHEEAERTAHHGDWWEERALRDLHALAEAATHFHQQVESWWQDPNHTRQDYRNLVYAYRTAKYSFEWAHSFQYIRRDFQRLGSLIEELRRYYDGGWDPHDPHDPHNPWDPHHPDPH